MANISKRPPPPADLDDNPPLGDDFFVEARRGRDVLSAGRLAASAEEIARRKGGRPTGEGGPKAAVSLRLDTGVVNHLRAQGRGWQTRVNDALARLIATGQL